MITSPDKIPDNIIESELFYRSLIVNSLDGILITTPEGLIRFASISVTNILGYKSEELVGTSAFDHVHPADMVIAREAFMDEVKESPRHKFISIRLKQKSGDWLWCVVRGHNLLNVPTVNGVLIYFYDDTIRRKAKDDLIEREERYRHQAMILKNVSDVIITTDLNRVITSWNRVFEEMTGILEKDAVGRFFDDVLSVTFSGLENEAVLEVLSNEGVWKGEMSFKNASGEFNYLLITLSILFDHDQQPIGLLGVGKDITDRKKAEAALRESEQEFRNLIQNLRQGVQIPGNHCHPHKCNSRPYHKKMSRSGFSLLP